MGDTISVRLTRSLTALILAVGLIGPLAHGADAATAPVNVKRGIAAAMYLKTAPGKLTGAGAGWSYNWTYRVPAAIDGLDVVPMIRSASSISDAALATLTQGRLNGNYRYLLGFNEPDNVNQANLTPTQAANLWPKLQKTGLILGSPVPAVPTNGWIKSFMGLVTERHLRVDFIALHFYASITDDGALARIKSQVELIRSHYGKPIWVTELGIIDSRTSPGSASVNWAKAIKFMRAVTAMLDSKPYVQRYAWMADNVASRSNLKWSTMYDAYGRITPMGTAYKNLP